MGAGRALQRQAGADLGLLADAHVGGDLVAREHPFDQQLDLATGRLGAEQARLDDPGVVEHQQVARVKQVGQFVKDAVDRLGVCAVEQPGAAAFRRRVLRDAFRREREVEVAQRPGARRGYGSVVHAA